MQPGYIFIGGSYRTGTDLLRNILNASDEVAICGETHYMGAPKVTSDLRSYLLRRWRLAKGHNATADNTLAPGSRQMFRRIGDMSTNEGVFKVVDYIYDRRPNFWRWLAEHVNQAEFLQRVLDSDRSERALFDLLLAYYAGPKPIRGEKTPAHIDYLPKLLEWFPQARFIHMFRDPRAIFISQKKKKGVSDEVGLRHRLFRQTGLSYEIYMSFSVAVHWLHIVQLHETYRRLYPDNYYLVRFEDMIANTHNTLDDLCAFLGIRLTDAMLARRVVNSSFKTSDSPAVAGFDPSAIDRWRQHLHPLTNRWFTWMCREHLQEFGYQL